MLRTAKHRCTRILETPPAKSVGVLRTYWQEVYTGRRRCLSAVSSPTKCRKQHVLVLVLVPVSSKIVDEDGDLVTRQIWRHELCDNECYERHLQCTRHNRRLKTEGIKAGPDIEKKQQHTEQLGIAISTAVAVYKQVRRAR